MKFSVNLFALLCLLCGAFETLAAPQFITVGLPLPGIAPLPYFGSPSPYYPYQHHHHHGHHHHDHHHDYHGYYGPEYY